MLPGPLIDPPGLHILITPDLRKNSRHMIDDQKILSRVRIPVHKTKPATESSGPFL